jgi:YVTN family beta-propeller protein
MHSKSLKVLAFAAVLAGCSTVGIAQTVKTQIDFPNATLGITANPVTNRVYVVAPTLNGIADNLAVIDGNQDVLLLNVSVPFGAAFTTVNYLTNQVYVAGCNYLQNPSPCTVTVIDGKTNTVTATIAVTSDPGLGLTGITVNPIDGRVYVANGNDNVIDVINGKTNKLISSIDLQGNSPASIAINPILDRLYVPYGSNLTAVVNLLQGKVVSTTTYGSTTVGAAVNIVTGKVYVTDDEVGPSMTGVLNFNGAVAASVAVGDSPLGVDVDPITNLAFVASSAVDEVSVIDGKTNTIKSVVTSVPASYLAVNYLTQKLYVSGRVGVIVVTEK